MADHPKAADTIGRYRRDLIEQGVEGDLLDDIVRDMAYRLHAGELASAHSEEQAHA